MESACCDAPVRSTLFKANGQKVCDIPDHRDPTWVTKTTIQCLDPSTGKLQTTKLIAP